MTDEQIEKALEYCQWAITDCKNCPLDPKKPCTTNLHIAALEYIARLKDEIAGLTGALEALKTDNDNLTRTLEEANNELKERTDDELKAVRKETVKEILQELLALCGGQGGVCYDVDIKALAKNYGVEVEE